MTKEIKPLSEKMKVFEKVFGHSKLENEVDTDFLAFQLIWEEAQLEFQNSIKQVQERLKKYLWEVHGLKDKRIDKIFQEEIGEIK